MHYLFTPDFWGLAGSSGSSGGGDPDPAGSFFSTEGGRGVGELEGEEGSSSSSPSPSAC